MRKAKCKAGPREKKERVAPVLLRELMLYHNKLSIEIERTDDMYVFHLNQHFYPNHDQTLPPTKVNKLLFVSTFDELKLIKRTIDDMIDRIPIPKMPNLC